jgi:hypothetical protein
VWPGVVWQIASVHVSVDARIRAANKIALACLALKARKARTKAAYQVFTEHVCPCCHSCCKGWGLFFVIQNDAGQEGLTHVIIS